VSPKFSPGQVVDLHTAYSFLELPQLYVVKSLMPETLGAPRYCIEGDDGTLRIVSESEISLHVAD
jgi:hypothetical protein